MATHSTVLGPKATEIECLACAATRVVHGSAADETGECPRCGNLGWARAADLDPATQTMIVNGLLARAAGGSRGASERAFSVGSTHPMWQTRTTASGVGYSVRFVDHSPRRRVGRLHRSVAQSPTRRKLGA
jgi:hypothetical protein